MIRIAVGVLVLHHGAVQFHILELAARGEGALSVGAGAQVTQRDADHGAAPPLLDVLVIKHPI